MKIGIISAMQEEIQLIKEDMSVFVKKVIGMREYYSGQLYNKDVVLVLSRCGKVAAASTVTTLIQSIELI